MGSVWKRLNRINKRASKFKFTASYSELWLECGHTWQPSSLSVIWTRKSRRVVSDPLRWEPTMRNPYLGMCVWPVPENKEILVTMFRDPNKEEYDNKDWFFILENVEPSGKRKPVAQGRLNMRDFSTAIPTQHNLTVKLRPISKKVSSAKLTLTLTSELLKEGKATDEDMRSIASLVSNSTMSGDYGNSLLKGLEEELPEDEAQETVRKEISSLSKELESLKKRSLLESTDVPVVTVRGPDTDVRSVPPAVSAPPAQDFSEKNKIKQVDILPGKDVNHRFKSTYNGPVGDYDSKPSQPQPEESPGVELPVELPPVPKTVETPEMKPPEPEPVVPTQNVDKVENTPAKYSRTKSQEFRDYQQEFMLSSIIDFGPLQPVADNSSAQMTSTPISKPYKKRENTPPASPVKRIPAAISSVEKPKTPSPPPPVVEEEEKCGKVNGDGGVNTSSTEQTINGANSSTPPPSTDKTEITPSKSFLLDLNRNNSVQAEASSSDSTPIVEKSKPQSVDPKLEKILTDRTNSLLRKNPTKTADDLLDWAKAMLSSYSNVKVTNFTTSWRNGLAFCALLHSFYPDLIPYDALTSHDIKHNCKLAFEAGEKLGIPRVIEPESMVIKRIPDKLAVITYLHQLRSAMGREETNLLYEKSKEEQKIPGTGVRKSFSEGHISLFSLSATNDTEKSDLATIEENPGVDIKPEKVREYQTRAKTLIEKARSESRDSDPEEAEELNNEPSQAGLKSSPPKVVMRQRSSTAKSKKDNRISYFDNEMQMLDSEQVEIDKQAAILDKRLRETSEDDQVLYDALLQQWFTLVNKKNALLRRQMQLNILKKEDNLEKKLGMLQEELRNLSEIEENRKTDSDREREELLLQELVLVVNKRNELVMQRDEEERILHEEEQLDEEITMPENNHLRINKRDDCKMQ